ncbi:hypothetical protein ABW19_dt0206091 [Dactylella cylindrospora]|nr:hypothetical protein ABW19_dt0206091 [Dactylella cylindrospora]
MSGNSPQSVPYGAPVFQPQARPDLTIENGTTQALLPPEFQYAASNSVTTHVESTLAGEYLGCDVPGHPYLDWKPVMTKRWPLLGLALASFLLGSLMLGMWALATFKPVAVSTDIINLEYLGPLWIWPAILFFEAWYLVDRGFRQLLPYLRLASETPYPAKESLLLDYYPNPTWYYIFTAIKRRHWMHVVTFIGTLFASVIIAFQSTLLGLGYIIVSKPIELFPTDSMETGYIPFLNSSFGQEVVRADLTIVSTTSDELGNPTIAGTWNSYEFAAQPFYNATGYSPKTREVWGAETIAIVGFLNCTPATVAIVEDSARITDPLGCSIDLPSAPGAEPSFYWGIAEDSAVDTCNTRHFFGYGSIQTPIDTSSYLAISCLPSIKSQSVNVRAVGSEGTTIAAKRSGKFTRIISNSVFDESSSTRLTPPAESVVMNIIRAAVVDNLFANLQYWFTYLTPTGSQWDGHAIHLDDSGGATVAPPKSASDLEYLAERAYRRVVSRILYTAFDSTIHMTYQQRGSLEGKIFEYPFLLTILPQNALTIAVSYYILTIIAIAIVVVTSQKHYRYSGLKSDPSTLLYQMVMISRNTQLRDCFSGLEKTMGTKKTNTRLADQIFRLGYWRLGNIVEYKLDYVEGPISQETQTSSK